MTTIMNDNEALAKWDDMPLDFATSAEPLSQLRLLSMAWTVLLVLLSSVAAVAVMAGGVAWLLRVVES